MLDRIVADFTSWHWWVTVVFVGLTINLASAYLKDPLDRALSRRQMRRAAKDREEFGKIRERADSMLKDPRLITLQVAEEMRGRLLALLFLSYAVLAASGAVLVGSTMPRQALFTQLASLALSCLAGGSLILALWMHNTARAGHAALNLRQAIVLQRADA